MFKDLEYDSRMQEAMDAITSDGAFLTVTDGKRTNTMTIGWASIGYFWGKPVFTVVVRDSRYTYELIENTKEFTVSIPLGGTMKEELRICGTKSGRDIDKFAECNLQIQSGKQVQTPIISQCDLHYECRILYKTKMNPENLDESCQKLYPKRDYHTFYLGEIVACYGK